MSLLLLKNVYNNWMYEAMEKFFKHTEMSTGRCQYVTGPKKIIIIKLLQSVIMIYVLVGYTHRYFIPIYYNKKSCFYFHILFDKPLQRLYVFFLPEKRDFNQYKNQKCIQWNNHLKKIVINLNTHIFLSS